jgi:hypothetical protein
MAMIFGLGADQIKQNHGLLNATAIFSSVSGLLVWSTTPFVSSNTIARYFSLFYCIGAGSTAIYCGNKLEKSKLLFLALQRAQDDDFLHQIASLQYARQQHWNQLAGATSNPFGTFFPEAEAEPVKSAEVPPDGDFRASTSTNTNAPIPEVREVPPDGDFRDSDPEVAEVNPLAGEVLVRAVSEAVTSGKSDTWIIENILNMKGRQFAKGKTILEFLRGVA